MSKNKYDSYGSLDSFDYSSDSSVLISKDTTNYPSPYNQPQYAYGKGPRAANIINEYTSVPNKDIFNKTPVLREPTLHNPMMNVMPLDYDMQPLFEDYNRYGKRTYPNKRNLEIKERIKTEFEKGLYQDADSLLWNRVNSQRQFVSMPVGSVPNNQPEFAQWLYGVNNETCKSSSIYQNYGLKYTDGSLLCDGYNVTPLTNKGLLNGTLMSSVDQSKGI
jgi:hypothetical protein